MNTDKQKIYLKDYEAPHYFIDKVALDFDLFEDHASVKSLCEFQRNPKFEAETPFVLEGQNLELISLKLDGHPLAPSDFEVGETQLTIFSVPERGELEIITKIKPQENKALEGLYKSGKIFCTQCEAHGFQRITYFVDRPDNMAVYTTTIRADASAYPVLLSNGNLIDSGILADGRHFATWQDPFKKPSYLFALVAGQLDMIEDEFVTRSGRRVSLKVYTDPGKSSRLHFAMEALKKSMRWDEERFGREYDLDVFMIVAVDSFNMGAMENKGLNIFNSMVLLADPDTATDATYEDIESIIGHEYFHNWTGNRITCRDWFQLSLKEGLTVYRDQEFTSDLRSRAVKRIEDVSRLRSHQFVEDSGPNAHPVRPEFCYSVDNFYTSTVYDKGAEVIRMIATLLGDEGFRRGMDLYFQLYDGQAVTTEDFVRAMEQANNIDLDQFRLWYSQAGTPEVEVGSEYSPDRKTLTLFVKQSLKPTPGQDKKLPMVIPLRLGLINSKGEEIPLPPMPQGDLLLLNQSEQEFNFPQIAEKPVLSLFRGFSAPVKWVHNYSRADLLHLMKFDQDPFNRWEAGQRLLLEEMVAQAQSLTVKEDSEIEFAEDVFAGLKSCLEHAEEDPLFAAKLLTLPAFSYVAQFLTPLHPEALFKVQEQLKGQVGQKLQSDWQALYKKTSQQLTGPYQHNSHFQGLRAVRQLALTYLVAGGDQSALALAQEQYFAADNMTDRVAALSALRNLEGQAERERCFTDFFQRWGQDSVVFNTWLSLEAASTRLKPLARIKELTSLPTFSFDNPNNLRSLVGSFCRSNPLGFHNLDASGYSFLAEQVLQIDSKNPQLAARLVAPLCEWKQLEPQRSSLMRQELERIASKPDLSPNSFELVSNALKEGST